MKYVWKALGIYLAFLLQSLVFENLRIFSCSPDILVAVVIIVAVSEDFVPASILGGFAGLLCDVMYGEVFGISILLYIYLSLLVSLAADKLRSRRLQRKTISSDNGFVFLYSGFRILIPIAPFPRRFKWYNPCDAFIGAFFHLRGKKQHNRKEAGVRLEP